MAVDLVQFLFNFTLEELNTGHRTDHSLIVQTLSDRPSVFPLLLLLTNWTKGMRTHTHRESL